MTGIIVNAALRIASLAPKSTRLLGALSQALDSFAESQMRHVVAECHPRRSRRDIGHHRRMMRLSSLRRDQHTARTRQKAAANWSPAA
jgi:sigma54-dependent transcription regulator